LEKNDELELAWQDYLTVGVPQMDEEHRQFIARVNELNRAIVEAKDKATVRQAMELMLADAALHFKHEEELLAQWEYPETAAHTAKHGALTAQFERVLKEFEEAEFSFVWAVKGLRLKQMLVAHLLKEDLKYQGFLQSRLGLH
jgi:hemerythrin